MSEAKFIKGPWRWRLNEESKRAMLVAEHSGTLYVMAFDRWGMGGAQPSFYVDGFLVKGKDLAVNIPGQEHNASWNQTISHPDAAVIAASPDMYAMLVEAREELRTIRSKDGAVYDPTLCTRIDAILSKARGES